MRYYDTLTGTRFDMNHPCWKKWMLNKDKSVKKRMDFKKAGELESKGIIQLVPSTTEAASCANNFGIFSVAANWGMEMTIAAFEDWLASPDATLGMLDPGHIKDMAKAAMDKPRDIGSELHESFHLIGTGELKYDSASSDQQKFYDQCLVILEKLGLPPNVETEVQFANDRYGGTCDYHAGDVGLDWKTVKDWRVPRVSEMLQMGGYAKAMGWKEAWLAQYHQTKHTFKVYRFTTDGEPGKAYSLTQCYEVFKVSLACFTAVQGLSKVKVGWKEATT